MDNFVSCLILKPVLNYKDIKEYMNCGTTKAYEIIKICKTKYNGTIKYEPKLITTESLMLYLGTTREKELSLIGQSENEELSKTNIQV